VNERPLNDVRKAELECAIDEALEVADRYNAVGQLRCRELSLAVTKLEEAKMWAQRVHAATGVTVG
jgi:hypothetical protein